MKVKKNNNSPHFPEVFVSGVSEILRLFPLRTQNIIRERYNLEGSFLRGKTLEAIGKKYGITRERVRQIIQFAMKTAREHGIKSVDSAVEKIDEHLIQKGGIFAKKPLLSELGVREYQEIGSVEFILDLSENFNVLLPSRFVTHAVSRNDFDMKSFFNIVQVAENILSENEQPEYIETFSKRLKEHVGEIEMSHLEAYLMASATIDRNPLGEWGMNHWGEIQPKSAGQRAHLVLRHNKKPMHFTEIAREINQLGLSLRKANPQTVHNELIKSPLFSLFGRGVYGLSEWKK